MNNDELNSLFPQLEELSRIKKCKLVIDWIYDDHAGYFWKAYFEDQQISMSFPNISDAIKNVIIHYEKFEQ